MQAKIIPIGTSKGVRIPKHLLEKYALNADVFIEDHGDGILIKPIKKARSGWREAGSNLKAENTAISMPNSDWDKDEWQW